MRVVCVQDFGFHKRGDVLEVPDDAELASQYYVPEHETDIVPATAAPEAVGREAGPSEAVEPVPDLTPVSPGDARREGEDEPSLFHPSAPGDRPREEGQPAAASADAEPAVNALEAKLEELEGGK